MHDSTGASEGGVLQPGLAGEAAAGGHRSAVLREARHLPGQAPAHQSRRGPRREPDRDGSCPIYPTTEASGIAGWEYGEWVDRGAQRGRGPIQRPGPAAVLGRPRPGRASRSAFGHPPPRDTWAEKTAARQRLAFDELLRLQLEVVMRRHESERDARGIRHIGRARAEPRRDLVARVPRAAQLRAHQGTAHTPSRRSTVTWRGRCR